MKSSGLSCNGAGRGGIDIGRSGGSGGNDICRGAGSGGIDIGRGAGSRDNDDRDGDAAITGNPLVPLVEAPVKLVRSKFAIIR